MTPDLAYDRALVESEKPVGQRALIATLADLGPRDWATPAMTRLLQRWLGGVVLERSGALAKLEALAQAGAVPALWDIAVRAPAVRAPGTMVPQPVAQAIVLGLLERPVLARDRDQQTHWLEQAWHALGNNRLPWLAGFWTRKALQQDRPEWLALIQKTDPDVLHTWIPAHPLWCWWRSGSGVAEWNRALAWGMDPTRLDAEGVPFWAHLTALDDGGILIVPKFIEAWAQAHDPQGWLDVQRDRYIKAIQKARPEQAWPALTSRDDWPSVVDRAGTPAVFHAVANDMYLLTAWDRRLEPWRSQLTQWRNAQGQHLLHAIVDNDLRSNSNDVRVDAFKGALERGLRPERHASGEGWFAHQPTLVQHQALKDLLPALSAFPDALWGGSDPRIHQVVQTLIREPFDFARTAGWMNALRQLPATASAGWQGLAAVWAAAWNEPEVLERAIAAGARCPDLTHVPAGSVSERALTGALGHRLRIQLRHQALQDQPVQVPRGRARPRA